MLLRNHNKTDLRAAVGLNKVEQNDQKLLLLIHVIISAVNSAQTENKLPEQMDYAFNAKQSF